MANATWMEAGTDATQGTSFYGLIAGSGTSDSSVFFTGARSFRLEGNTAQNAYRSKTAICADAGSRITVRFRTTAIPASSSVAAIIVSNASNVSILSLNFTNAGKFSMQAVGAGAVTGTQVLAVDTWYRIAIAYTITNSTTFTCRVYINGKLDISNSNSGTLTNVTTDRLILQNNTNLGASKYFYFDDIYVDNGTDLADPGNIIVTNKRPNANGAAVGYTTQIGSGGSGYGTGHSPQVNEQPLSTTNGWSITSASLITEEYSIEGASTGDLDVSNARKYTLVDYMGWAHVSSSGTTTRNIIVNGSATNISTTTTATTFSKVAGSATYPSGNTAIGVNDNSVNSLTRLFECGILLAYKLPRRISIT